MQGRWGKVEYSTTFRLLLWSIREMCGVRDVLWWNVLNSDLCTHIWESCWADWFFTRKFYKDFCTVLYGSKRWENWIEEEVRIWPISDSAVPFDELSCSHLIFKNAKVSYSGRSQERDMRRRLWLRGIAVKVISIWSIYSYPLCRNNFYVQYPIINIYNWIEQTHIAKNLNK